MQPPHEDLAHRMRRQAETCESYGSVLYGTLLAAAADDYEAGGPTAEVLAGVEHDPPGSVPALRLMGALHRLVLERQAPLLATHYPSVGGEAGPDGAWDAARALLAARGDDVRTLLRQPVQTNEPGRQAVLYGGLAHLGATTGLPVRLLEVGASAGLNLVPEAVCYRVDGVPGATRAARWCSTSRGSPVRARRTWRCRWRPGPAATRRRSTSAPRRDG